MINDYFYLLWLYSTVTRSVGHIVVATGVTSGFRVYSYSICHVLHEAEVVLVTLLGMAS